MLINYLTRLLLVSCFSSFAGEALCQTSAMTIRLNPWMSDNQTAKGFEVSYQVADRNETQPLILLFDLFHPVLDRNRDTITNLRITDRKGNATAFLAGDTLIGLNKYQVWRTNRSVISPVQVSYRVEASVPFPIRRGPHIDLQQAGGGLSGSAMSFLLLPPLSDTVDIKLIWKLPENHQVVTSAGAGNIRFNGTRNEFYTMQVMEGPLLSFPSDTSTQGLSIHSLGRSETEMKKAAPWNKMAYESLRKKLLGSPDKAFRFFIRSYDGGPLQSGVAVKNCFTIYLPKEMSAISTKIRSLTAHEMVHAFVEGLLMEDEGKCDWYNEGIADYLAIKIPYDAGLFTTEEYIQLVNGEAAMYYTNSLRETPENDMPNIKWLGRNSWSLGYTRGALYFANLDAKLKRITAGKFSVIDLVNEITSLNRAGKTVSDSSWRQLLKEKAGDWAVQDFDEMESGRLLIPDRDCFPGLVPEKIQSGFFNPGFEKPLRIRAGEKIEGLDPESNAAKAGLKEGDIISKTIAINDTYNSYDNYITITVKRNGKDLPVRFQPRKGSVTSYRWIKAKK